MDENNNQSHNPPSQRDKTARARIKTGAKKTAKVSGKVFLYTNPGIFLSGLLGSRIKQRFFAKKQIEDMGKKGEESQAASDGAKKVAPQKPSRFSSFRKTKLWEIGTAPIKYGTVAGLFYVGAKKLKAKKQTDAPQPAENINSAENATTIIIPPIKKWIDYQKIWNNSRIKKAIDRGYNRFTLLQKIRNSKITKATIKYGKYAALGPIGGAAIDTHSFQKRRATQRNTEPSEPSSDTRLWGGYGGSGTPSPGIGKRAYNRFVSPRLNQLNSSLGRGKRNRIARGGGGSLGGSAGNAVGQEAKQLTEVAAKAFLRTPPGWTVIGVIIALILFIGLVVTVVIILSEGGGDDSNLQGGAPIGTPVKNTNPVPGFTLTKSVSSNNLTEATEITYTLTYTFSPNDKVKIEDITIFDTIPDNTTLVADKSTGKPTLDTDGKTISWPLSDPANQALKSFSFTVLPIYSGTFLRISNSSWATANGALTLADPGGSSPNACTKPKEGTGYCSYDNLLPYFNNQPDLALTASLICNLESGSNPFSTNKVCPDYSMGLFQINLIAHCGGAFSPPPACTVLNPMLKDACEQRFLDPIENIKYAYLLYLSGGTGFTSNKWSVYPEAKKTLDSCANI